MSTTVYWDEKLQRQMERPCTPDEEADIAARKAAAARQVPVDPVRQARLAWGASLGLDEAQTDELFASITKA